MRKQQIPAFRFAKIALICFLNLHVLQAQSDLDHLGTWNILNVRLKLTQRWSLFAEPQLRSLRFYDHFHYYEIKGGVQFNLNPNFSFLAGFGDYHTYQEGGNFVEPQLNDEFRSWLQITMSQQLHRFKFEHRYRAEQRWPSSGYRNRFRYRLNAVFALGDKKLTPGDWYLTASDEIFFTDRAPYFERNRFFMGAGYLVSDRLTLQACWMKQFDYRINDETGRNFLQISVLTEFSVKRDL